MAANKNEGEVEVTLDKRRILKLNMRARTLFEQNTGGTTIDEFFLGLQGGKLSIDKLATLLWVCLLHEDRLLKREDSENLIEHAPGKTDSEKLEYILKKLTETYCLRQGVDFKELEQRAKESENAGKEDDRPPVPNPAGPAS